MSWNKLFAITTMVIFVLGAAMFDCALAGEKMKWHGAAFTTDWQQIKVGDVEGHVIAVSKAKQLYINEKTGEKHVSNTVDTFDMNLKTGQGSLRGYGVSILKNGDKTYRRHEGKSIGKGHWHGTWSWVKGTGKYEGIKGGGTWETFSMGRGEPSYVEVEGEMELPAE
ncbi:MAG: hypothetical protein K9K79_01695 [Desulfohalobiaceae bacterium]|nr:hypothetical protein [Desulfohalobiaceae bacterium]